MKPIRTRARLPFRIALGAAAALAGSVGALLGTCGPFTDTANDAFCPFVLEVFYLGITTGTTPATYDPSSDVTRLQMAAFLSRSVDSVLKRGSLRARLNKFWTPTGGTGLGITDLPGEPRLLDSDGEDIWTICGNAICRVHASDGRLLGTWTGTPSPQTLISAIGKVFVLGWGTPPGRLYRIDPTQAPGAATMVASNLGVDPDGMAFDGSRIWTADDGGLSTGDVSIVTPGPSAPYAVTIVSSGFVHPFGALYDGANVWITDYGPGTLLKLDGNGAILQTVTVGTDPRYPLFDGTNIWVPNYGASSVSVVRRSSGAILGTLTGNGLNTPYAAAFDGERVLVTNFSGNSVSLFKAADLTPLGVVSTGSATKPYGACTDGLYFWVGLFGTSQLAKF